MQNHFVTSVGEIALTDGLSLPNAGSILGIEDFDADSLAREIVYQLREKSWLIDFIHSHTQHYVADLHSDNMLCYHLSDQLRQQRILISRFEAPSGGGGSAPAPSTLASTPPPRRPRPAKAVAAEEEALGPQPDEVSQVKTLRAASEKGSPFCEVCEKAAKQNSRKSS